MKKIMAMLGLIVLINYGANLNAQSNEDLKEIFQSISDEWTSYAESKNLRGIVSLYAADAVIDGNAKDAVVGRYAIKDDFKQWFEGSQSIDHSSSVISATVFGDNAFVYGSWTVNQIAKDGSKNALRGNWVNHNVKIGSKWKIKLELWNDAEFFESRKKE